jgi:PST family polysaccharide transporter
MVGFATRNLDNILVGKYMGSAQLGVYSRAYQFLLLPVKNISGIITKVLFPAFSQIQDEKERVLNIFTNSVWLISNLVAPFMLCFYFCADAFTMLVLGHKWAEVIPLLKIFALTGFIQSVGTLVGSVFNSQAKTKLHFAINLVSSIATLIIITVALNFNIIILAWGITLISFLILVVNYYYVARILETSLAHLLKKLSVSAFSSALVFMILFGVKYFLFNHEVSWLQLVLLPLLIFSSYFAIVRVVDKDNLAMVFELL